MVAVFLDAATILALLRLGGIEKENREKVIMNRLASCGFRIVSWCLLAAIGTGLASLGQAPPSGPSTFEVRTPVLSVADTLPSRNDGTAKQSIMDFVKRIMTDREALRAAVRTGRVKAREDL